MTRWVELTRASEWDASKASLLLVVVLMDPNDAGWRVWAGAMLFGVGFFASAYLVNDLSDRAVDIAAGKSRPVHQWSTPAALVITALHLVICGCGVALLPFAQPELLVAGLTLSLVSLFGYSLPPLRWKERGVWGLAVAAAGQRVFPMLVVAGAVHVPAAMLALVLVLALLQGVRWILIHQIQDAEADARTGVHTWTTAHGQSRARALLRFGVSAEAAAAVALLGVLSQTSPTVSVVLAAWLVALPAWYGRIVARGESIDLANYRRAPGANFLLLALPVALLLLRRDVLGVASFLLLSGRYLSWQLRDAAWVLSARPSVAR